MEAATQLLPRRVTKSEAAFRTISEVAEDLDVPQHVLRFWESKFSQIRPLKRGGGRRYYRPEDVMLLRRIRDLLYRDGYTIKGVQKLLRDAPSRQQGETVALVEAVPAALPEESAEEACGDDEITREIRAILDELTSLRDELRKRLR
jgi:DNA-binding transcriptional MerR regulator